MVILCSDTGQDGDIRAGADLSYTDNLNGTITDNNTGLMWAKNSGDESIHSVVNLYAWVNAFAVYVAGLNTASFAGYTDWRLPNVKELQSIVNYGSSGTRVSPEFNTGCGLGATVLTGSCTAGSYWSSTTDANDPTQAWIVGFVSGNVVPGKKSDTDLAHVRAVRDGL